MARIRTIKPEFWQDERLSSLPRDARLLFIGLWNIADDYGRLRGHPAFIKGQVFPYDEDVNVAGLLGVLAAAGRIIIYDREGQAFIWVRKFSDHQKMDKRTDSKLPEPTAEEMAASTRKSAEPAQEKALEWKGKEGKGKEQGPPPAPVFGGSPVAAMGGTPAPPSLLAAAHPDRRNDPGTSPEDLRAGIERIWLQKRGKPWAWRSGHELELRPAFDLAGGDVGEVLRVFSAALDRSFPRLTKLPHLAEHWNDYAATKEPAGRTNPNARATEADRWDASYQPPLDENGEVDLLAGAPR